MKTGSLLQRLWDHPIVVMAVVLAVGTGIAVATGMPISRVSQIAIYTLYAGGVNFLIGYLGLVPFGASFFFGCASYALAILGGSAWGGNEITGIVIALAFSLVLGLIVGAVILRRRGLYFSLLTLACSQIAFEVAFKWTSVTGGENGLQNVTRPLFPSTPAFNVFAIVVSLGTLWVLWRIVHAPFGRVMQAIRDNEQRVASLGFDTYRIKLIALTIAGGAIGVAGGLMALLLQGVYANNLGWQHAGDPVLMAALGGVHHFLGPLWGAIIFIVLEDRLSAFTENWWLIFAPIVIAFALLSSEGVQGILQRLVRRNRWTLTRHTIPARPATIAPYVPSTQRGAATETGVPLLAVHNLSKRFGSIVTQNDISLEMSRTGLHSLIGPNGAGKTTFFNLLTGVHNIDGGSIMFEGKSIARLSSYKRARLGMSRSFQILSVFPNLTAFENVRIAVQAADRQWNGFWRDAYDNEAANGKVWSLLDAVGLADRAAEICSALSHGEKRLLEIAVSLATDAKLLLLDEPLAGLAESDRKIVSALIQRLAKSYAVLLIEHDIDRVLAMSDRITVLHQGRIIADGKPAEVAGHPEVITAYLGQAHGTAPVMKAPRQRTATIGKAAETPLLKVEGLSAGYGGGTVLEDLELIVNPGEVVALLGRNGVGKTTALRAITGTLPISAGRITFDGRDITRMRPDEINRLGISLVPEGRRLFPNLTVQENLKIATRTGGAPLEEICELFPKLKLLMKSRAENLSGGERQMVAISRALMVPSRLILLDEPFEGLAPSVVHEVREAVAKLTTRASLVIVEHHAESVLAMADRAYVLVNGHVAFSGAAETLAADQALQERLLGITNAADILPTAKAV
jgi:branched-chain amino acid transport system ATP-binding protein